MKAREERRQLLERAKARIANEREKYVEYETRDFTDPLYIKIARMVSEGADEQHILDGYFDVAMIEPTNLQRLPLDDDDEIDECVLTKEEAHAKQRAHMITQAVRAQEQSV